MNDLEKKIIDAAKKYAIRDGYHDELYKDEQAFEAGAKWALSQDSTSEKVKELTNHIQKKYDRIKDLPEANSYIYAEQRLYREMIEQLNAIIEAK